MRPKRLDSRHDERHVLARDARVNEGICQVLRDGVVRLIRDREARVRGVHASTREGIRPVKRNGEERPLMGDQTLEVNLVEPVRERRIGNHSMREDRHGDRDRGGPADLVIHAHARRLPAISADATSRQLASSVSPEPTAAQASNYSIHGDPMLIVDHTRDRVAR